MLMVIISHLVVGATLKNLITRGDRNEVGVVNSSETKMARWKNISVNESIINGRFEGPSSRFRKLQNKYYP